MLERPGVRRENITTKTRKVFKLALGAAVLSALGCGKEAVAPNQETQILKQFRLENSFPVNEGALNKEAQKAIEEQVVAFLKSHNTDEKFQELLKARIVIECSSDERPTISWGDRGNEALSEARLVTLDSLVHSVVNNFPYSKELEEEEVKRFKSKTYIKRMPGGAWGKGFIPLTQVVNPATGKNYTEEEIKTLTPEQKNELYDGTRYANVNFELPGPNERKIQYNRLLEVIDSYDAVTLMLDRSESMTDDYGIFAHKVTEQIKNSKDNFSGDSVSVVTFEQEADEGSGKIALSQLPEALEKMSTYGGDEKILASLSQTLARVSKIEGGKRQAIIALTDEGIQDFSEEALNALIKKGKESHCDVYIGLLAKDGLISFMDLEGLSYDLKYYAESFATEKAFFVGNLSPEARVKFVRGKIVKVDVTNDGSLKFYISQEGFNALEVNININYQDQREEMLLEYNNALEALNANYQQRIEGVTTYDKKRELDQEYRDKKNKIDGEIRKKLRELDESTRGSHEFLRELVYG